MIPLKIRTTGVPVKTIYDDTPYADERVRTPQK